jgi:hypothetical protein
LVSNEPQGDIDGPQDGPQTIDLQRNWEYLRATWTWLTATPGRLELSRRSPRTSAILAGAAGAATFFERRNQMINLSQTSSTKLVNFVLVLGTQALLVAGLSATARGQRRAAQNGDEEVPVFREYRGVQIGMAADEARKKLGGLKDKGDDQDFFVINDKETAQVVYDKAHKVSAISVDYLSGAAGVPTPRAVVGSDIEPKPDGSLNKLVRYQKAGFWVCYNKTAGDSPLISVTIQKIE